MTRTTKSEGGDPPTRRGKNAEDVKGIMGGIDLVLASPLHLLHQRQRSCHDAAHPHRSRFHLLLLLPTNMNKSKRNGYRNVYEMFLN